MLEKKILINESFSKIKIKYLYKTKKSVQSIDVIQKTTVKIIKKYGYKKVPIRRHKYISLKTLY